MSANEPLPREAGPAAALSDADVERIADRVYRLMLTEARLDVARRGEVPRRR